MGGYLLSLTPTFTQGLVLGQLSILALLTLILKYLFFESRSVDETGIPSIVSPVSGRERKRFIKGDVGGEQEPETSKQGAESAEWFDRIIDSVVQAYRLKLRDGRQDSEGDDVARQRIEQFLNRRRPQSLFEMINVSTADLGSSTPHISHVRQRPKLAKEDGNLIEVDLTYVDSVSVSLSTSVLFHYPMPNFARLPVSLNISLDYFSFTLLITPPDPMSPNPFLTISLLPDFTLDLNITSLIGSRAKLADVPKLHEMIQSHVRRILLQQGTWKIVLPGIANAEAVKKEPDEHSSE